MKYKNFTQAYFLIKNNDTYAYSLGKRAMAGAGGFVFLAIAFTHLWPSRFYARDQIWYQ